jgi:hypothetical protein
MASNLAIIALVLAAEVSLIAFCNVQVYFWVLYSIAQAFLSKAVFKP